MPRNNYGNLKKGKQKKYKEKLEILQSIEIIVIKVRKCSSNTYYYPITIISNIMLLYACACVLVCYNKKVWSVLVVYPNVMDVSVEVLPRSRQ